MNKLRMLYKNRLIFNSLISVILAVVLPSISSALQISKVHRILWLFLIVDVLYALWCGWDIKKHHQSRWLMLIFPAIFLIYAVIRYGYYIYFLALLYLGFSYLAYGLTGQKPAEIRPRRKKDRSKKQKPQA
ncbi:hypothetical protein ACFQ5M_12425 [Agrilactobacillus yilanensis]|uniref:Integral membrane protein n=1 Tax=Agrilactobacillus yilanensis TaxID=2485997 RepID=A0ABW4JD43_9LACO|nr:hypothetical protein [Agrilactobacillus yilanensis]